MITSVTQTLEIVAFSCSVMGTENENVPLLKMNFHILQQRKQIQAQFWSSTSTRKSFKGNPFETNFWKIKALTSSITTAQKMKFSIKDFFSKCDHCGFGHIYWRNLSWKTSFFVHWTLRNKQEVHFEKLFHCQ